MGTGRRVRLSFAIPSSIYSPRSPTVDARVFAKLAPTHVWPQGDWPHRTGWLRGKPYKCGDRITPTRGMRSETEREHSGQVERADGIPALVFTCIYAGNFAESARIATAIRALVHESGMSKPLLKQATAKGGLSMTGYSEAK